MTGGDIYGEQYVHTYDVMAHGVCCKLYLLWRQIEQVSYQGILVYPSGCLYVVLICRLCVNT